MKCFWKIPASHKLSSPTALKKEKGEGGGQGEQRKKKKAAKQYYLEVFWPRIRILELCSWTDLQHRSVSCVLPGGCVTDGQKTSAKQATLFSPCSLTLLVCSCVQTVFKLYIVCIHYTYQMHKLYMCSLLLTCAWPAFEVLLPAHWLFFECFLSCG